jgi:putative PIN family toxin of toxin-antitoxin system
VTIPVGVIDPNVVVAGVLTADSESPTAQIVDAMITGAFPFLLSVELLAEYREVLLRPKILVRHGLREDEVDALLVGLATMAAVREPAQPESGQPDVDAHLLALLAMHGDALLVTGDAALLDRAPAGRVVTPAQFVQRIATTPDRR